MYWLGAVARGSGSGLVGYECAQAQEASAHAKKRVARSEWQASKRKVRGVGRPRANESVLPCKECLLLVASTSKNI